MLPSFIVFLVVFVHLVYVLVNDNNKNTHDLVLLNVFAQSEQSRQMPIPLFHLRQYHLFFWHRLLPLEIVFTLFGLVTRLGIMNSCLGPLLIMNKALGIKST